MPRCRTERAFPLFATLSEAPPVESTRPFVTLATLGSDALLDKPRNLDCLDGSMTTCDSEPMCSIEEAANACLTRAPILGKSTRFVTIHRISSAPNMSTLSA